MTKNLIVCSALLGFFVIIGTIAPSFAIEDSEIKATEQIKKNPAMMEMLKKIELSKKILAEMQQKKVRVDQNAIKIQQIRNTAQASLNAQISRMNSEHDQFSPQNAFARFVQKTPTTVQPIYTGMFEYQQQKISSAKAERDRILASGGKFQDAWNAYYKISSANRVNMIQLNKNLNIKFVNSDVSIQNTFDEKGKLPRTSE